MIHFFSKKIIPNLSLDIPVYQITLHKFGKKKSQLQNTFTSNATIRNKYLENTILLYFLKTITRALKISKNHDRLAAQMEI